MAYKYTCPTERGHEKFKLTHREHNTILTNRKQSIFTKIDAYYRTNRIELHYRTNLLGKVTITLLLPFTFIMHGLSSAKDIMKEYIELFNEKKSGSFITEAYYPTKHNGEPSEIFLKLEEVYKKKRNKSS